MGKLIEYKVNDDTFVVFGEYAAVNADVFDPAELDYVMRNGSQMESFGETWAGSALDANYVLGRAIASYVNDDLSVEIVEVCDQIRDYKAQIQSYSHEVEGRKVPDVVVTPLGETADLVAISQTGAYYVNEGSNIFIATRTDGSLATNYEAFFESALAEDFDNGQMIFMTDVLRENLQEMAGEDFVSQDELNNKEYEKRLHRIIIDEPVNNPKSDEELFVYYMQEGFNHIDPNRYVIYAAGKVMDEHNWNPAQVKMAIDQLAPDAVYDNGLSGKGGVRLSCSDRVLATIALERKEAKKKSNSLVDGVLDYIATHNGNEAKTIVDGWRDSIMDDMNSIFKEKGTAFTKYKVARIYETFYAAFDNAGLLNDALELPAEEEKAIKDIISGVLKGKEEANFSDQNKVYDKQDARLGDVEILSVERPQPELQKELDYGVVHFREGNRSGYGMVPMELLEKKEGEIDDKAFVAELIKNDEFELPDLSSLPYYSDVSHALLSLYDLERKREPGKNSYYYPEVICEYVCEELEADMMLYPALAASIEIVPDENSEGVNINLTEDFRSCIADHYPSERTGRMVALDGGVPGKKIFEQVEHALDVVAERNTQLIPNGGEVERTLKEALKDFENLSGQEVLVSLKHEASFPGKRENCMVLYGTMKYETQKDRQDAYKWAKKWLNKSAKELDHELSKLQAKNKGR